MTTTQINARIDFETKALGDRALESIGYTPTSAIRALWGYVGKNLHNQKKLRSLFAQLEGDRSVTTADAAASERMKALEEGPLIIERALRDMGIDNPRPLDMSYKELREQAYLEKWVERGLL